MDRVILHCDLNSFYASVELLDYPHLVEKPVAICGDPQRRQGVVLAKNEPAKKFGVNTGQTVWEARKCCPELVLLPAHGENYRYYSKKVNEIYLEYTDLIEPYGVDESWLDISGTLHLFGKEPVALADEIRRRSKEELGLTLSIGVSFNKIFAKLGSDYKKPDATTYIGRDNYKDMVWDLPVQDLLYVGKSTCGKLNKFSIQTIGELARSPLAVIEELLGKHGTMIHAYANGMDDSPVESYYSKTVPKSLGQGLTFSNDLLGGEDIFSGILMLSDHVALRLRGHGLRCCGVQLTLRDPNFRQINRQVQLENPTYLVKMIAKTAYSLAEKYWNFKTPVRAISVTAISLIPEEEVTYQLSLFQSEPESQKKQEKLAEVTDKIRQKYGRHSVMLASAPQQKRNNGSIGFSLDESAD